MKRVLGKIKSKKGESLSETLVAMLVVALGSILLVTMVIAARNIIQKSEDAYNHFIAQHNALESRDTSVEGASVTVNESAAASLSNMDNSGDLYRLLDADAVPTENIKLYSATGDSDNNAGEAFIYDSAAAATSQ